MSKLVFQGANKQNKINYQNRKSDRTWARDYALQWFIFHASQRQLIFRFYITVIVALLAGYITYIRTVNYEYSWILGALLIVISYLFMRLDDRGRKLIHISEVYLKKEEDRVSSVVGLDIRIVSKSDEVKENSKFIYLSSFKVIYRVIFSLFMFCGIVIVYIDNKSGFHDVICKIFNGLKVFLICVEYLFCVHF